MKQRIVLTLGLVLFIAAAGFLAAIVLSPRHAPLRPEPQAMTDADKRGDQELASLLVRLVLQTRAVIGEHYTRAQSPVPGVDMIYKRWLAKNEILPAAVADRIFSGVVPRATEGRAWVKMVVEEPRNPHNLGDSVALDLLKEVKTGVPTTERLTSEAYYYAEPIKATQACLPCHGEPKGEPDPLFPQFKKNGWQAGEIVGAVVARVAAKE